MQFYTKLLLVIALLSCSVFAQQLPEMRLSESKNFLKNKENFEGYKEQDAKSEYKKNFQLKTRKTVTSYFGAGYSFMIFTNSFMSSAFPILDTRNGTFLTNINLFFGFSIAKAVTLEFSPTILFTSNNKQVDYTLNPQFTSTGSTYQYAHTSTNGIIALPLAINVRFFPLFKQKGFGRLFFIGGGAGAVWVREENDVVYNNLPNTFAIYGGDGVYRQGITTSQWAPLFRVISGFTGTGGQFGFGGELSYNIIPLKQDTSQPFATRFAKDMNSVDITLRFYFSL
ncbi:MAG TPA: hypothetical protein PK605_13875 [Ignavibacteria bacterium]|nr:hypothetical protein [Ignavibacteria bacterium]HRF66381.1 hypothetical protein [Ignavibacteria bacterium]HRJ05485.1 hypothetical protein [Ignavibacteria bacterium]